MPPHDSLNNQPTAHTHTPLYLCIFDPSTSRHLSSATNHAPLLLPFMHFTWLSIFLVRTLCNVSVCIPYHPGLSPIPCMHVCDLLWGPTHSSSSFASLPPQQKCSKEKSRLHHHHVRRKVSLHHVFTHVVVNPIPTYMYVS